MASIAFSAAASAVLPGATSALGLSGFGAQIFSGVLGGAAEIAGSQLDSLIFGRTVRREGPRLAELTVQTSTYGKMIPIVYGSARIAGNIIWAKPIKEVATTTTSSAGGKGGGTVSQSQTTFSYFSTLAVAICEGEIDEITRVWADAKLIDPNAGTVTYNTYLGSEDQLPDPIIESHEGVGEVPAHRGLSYVVIEDFPLADFGNRIPNFTFEVKRKVLEADASDEAVENLVKSIVMIPGSGEFVYDTQVEFKVPTQQGGGGEDIQIGNKSRINQNNVSGKADVLVALDQLESNLENVEWISPVVTWFGNDLDAGTCVIKPGVEFQTGATTEPDVWGVGSFTRSTAHPITLDVNGSPIYGGTPDDDSVIRMLQELGNRGYNIMFYPMFFMDVTGKPWRGRVTGSAIDVENFFAKTDGYNAFITHYANLVKDYVDAFVIGSELIGLTSVNDGSNNFPAVDELVSLAATVKGIVGSGVKVTYAADWSEYHHTTGGWYNMDPLWASANIDFIGIDAYFPLTDEPQSGYDVQKAIDGWTSGEGYDWIYTDPGRTIKQNLDPEFAWKNIQWWWENEHENPDLTTTAWVPESKKIWFTEYGFPSVDGATNQPNVFYDPNSVESFFPYHSKGRVDFRAQRQGLTATELKWKDSTMIERMFVWTWDARPFSFWPDLTNVWTDGPLWETGHWVQGKLGLSSLAAIVADIARRVGLQDADIDVSRLTDLVDGYVLTSRISGRDAIESLQQAYFFDAVESDYAVKFVPRGGVTVEQITEEKLIADRRSDVSETLNITREHEFVLPQKLDVNYLNRTKDYQLGNQHTQRQTVDSVHQVTLSLPIVMTNQQAKTIADVSLYNAWLERTSYSFQLPIEFAALEPTDIVEVTEGNATHTIRITEVQYGKPGILRCAGVAEDVSAYDFSSPPGDIGSSGNVVEPVGETQLAILDLPPAPSDNVDEGALRFAVAGIEAGWRGSVVYRSDDSGATYSQILTATDAAVMGSTVNALGTAEENIFDYSNTLTVILVSGELESMSELAVLNGANAALVGDEIVQFKTATLLEPNKYELSGLLRGRLGTEHEIGNHTTGERFILLDGSVTKFTMANNLINLPRDYKPVSIGDTLGNTTATSFTYQAVGLKPFAPVHITGSRDGSDNLTIDWVRRTRIGGDWRDLVDVPLSEESEAYEVDILDGQAVVRTITGLTSPQATYSAADQTTDFGSPQSSVSVNIYQLSSIVGRGNAGISVV